MQRVAQVPNRPLVMAAEQMDFAFEHIDAAGAKRYCIATFTPAFGGHDGDVTKLQWEVGLRLFDGAGGEIAATRGSGLTVYNDPSDAIATPAAFTVEDAVASKLMLLMGDVPAWIERTRGLGSLHARLAIGGELPAPAPPPPPPPPIVPGLSVVARPGDFGLEDEGNGKLKLASEFQLPSN